MTRFHKKYTTKQWTIGKKHSIYTFSRQMTKITLLSNFWFFFFSLSPPYCRQMENGKYFIGIGLA